MERESAKMHYRRKPLEDRREKIFMKHMNKKLALLMVMCLIVTSITAFPKSASANDREMAFSNSEAEGTFYVEGGEYSDTCYVSYSTNQELLIIYANYYEVHLRNDGTAWYIYNNKLCYYNNYVFGANKSTEIPAVAIYDDSEGNAYCYKTSSGEYYYLPVFADMKNQNYVTEKVADEDIPTETSSTQEPVTTNTPEPTVTNSPSPDTQTSSPASTSSPTDTSSPNPNTSSESSGQAADTSPSPSPQGSSDSETSAASVVKSGKTVEVTQDGETIAKVTFNKKKAAAAFTIEQKDKDKKVKNVKQAFVIGESYNYGYITKKNKFVTINRETGKVKKYSGKWKKATIKENVAVNIVTLKRGKKKTITGL